MANGYEYDKDGRTIWKMPPPTGTPEERGKAWDAALAAQGKVMLPSTGGKFSPSTPKTMDASTKAFIEAEAAAAKIKTANRIAKMKGRMYPKQIDNATMIWDGWNARWRWLSTRQPVKWNPDGSPVPAGSAATQGATVVTTPQTPAAKATKTTHLTAPKGKPDTYTKKPAPKIKATTVGADKKPAKAKAAAGTQPAVRGVGIIAAIIECIKRPEGGTISEIMEFIGKKFPERKPNKTTAQIQANKNATTKTRVEGRGLVYYAK